MLHMYFGMTFERIDTETFWDSNPKSLKDLVSGLFINFSDI